MDVLGGSGRLLGPLGGLLGRLGGLLGRLGGLLDRLGGVLGGLMGCLAAQERAQGARTPPEEFGGGPPRAQGESARPVRSDRTAPGPAGPVPVPNFSLDGQLQFGPGLVEIR